MKNKYKVPSILLFYLSVILIVVMVIHSVNDYQVYLQHPEYSAPYSAYLVMNSIIYGIPSILGWILSFIF